MKLNKLLSLVLTLCLSATLLVGCGNNSSNEDDGKLTIGMVTDVGGVNDQSFNQSAWEGLQRAEKELGVGVKYLESQQDADYAPNIETFIDEETDLIMGIGYKTSDAILEAAENYPEQQFAIVDHNYESDGKEIPENVTCIVFNEQESAYLTGLIAGKMTSSNKVGFIGGMQIPNITRFQYGYMAGVKASNPNAEVIVQYANSFTDAAKGKSIANQMYANGVDVIFTAAGNVGTGAIESAKEKNKYAIGVDRDQSNLAPQNVITSAIKRVDIGVYETVKQFKEGNFEGGKAHIYGLNEDGVGIASTTDKNVSKEILDYVNKEAENIINGQVKVPLSEKEYNTFIK